MKAVSLYLLWTLPVVFMLVKAIEMILSGSLFIPALLIVLGSQFTIAWVTMFTYYFVKFNKNLKK
jgi:hypothetical protein